MGRTRRELLRDSGLVLSLGLAGCQSSPSDDSATSEDGDRPAVVRAEPVASGFTAPLGVETVPGDDRRFVVDQRGVVDVFDGDGVRDRPYLDVRDRLVSLNPGYDERGLLGLAFHPEFDENGRLYARYSAPLGEEMPDGFDHTFVLSEFTADDSAARVDPGTERTLLEIPEPQSNHNGGALAFGPDGYLYVAVGDGGGGGDAGTGHADDWYDGTDGGNGQDVESNLLGSVLRIDVDQRGGDRPYGIPEDNPLVGSAGLDEHYAWGFRNPWRLSFDGTDLYVADVGQQDYEEVNRVVAGGNYGWNVREGTHCYGANSCPAETPDGTPLRDPVIEYSHGGDDPTGVAVIGGYRYRGDAMPSLRGTYVFGDYRLSGTLFVAQPTETGLWSVTTPTLDTTEGPVPSNALAFGRDRDGELYLCTTENSGPRGTTGRVYRLLGDA